MRDGAGGEGKRKITGTMEQELILYNSEDGKSRVTLLARDGSVWLNQSQLAELFATSVPNISQHINNILKDKELTADSVIKKNRGRKKELLLVREC